jgi:hypothetical protein
VVVDEIKREQDESMPREDLVPFAGQWVAIRNGKVIASDLDALSLRNQPEVGPGDLLLPVPDQGPDLLLL